MSTCLTARGVVRRARADGAVELELVPSAACRGFRGACLWRRLSAEPPLALPAARGLAPGTEVSISLPERVVLRTAWLSYGVPWVALLAGAALGAALTGSDLGTIAGAAASLAAGLTLSRAARRRFERDLLGRLELEPVE